MNARSEKLNELYKKHNVLTDGLQRVYLVSIDDKRLDMDRSTPIEIHFLVQDNGSSNNDIDSFEGSNPKSIVIKSRSWVKLIKEVCLALQQSNPKTLEELYDFRTEWSSAAIFSKNKYMVNMEQLADDLFVNVNHSANHMLWVIEDIIDFYEPKDCHSLGWFLIHRPPFSEPDDIRSEVESTMKKGFQEYLIEKSLSEEKITKVMKGIDALNYLLKKSRSSYDNFFLIDDALMLSNYKSKLITDLPKYVKWNDAQINTAKKYLGYLTEYFTKLKLEAKKHPIEFFIPVI